MKRNDRRHISSAANSASITIIAIVAMTVIAELSPVFKTWLKDSFSHHWIGKGVLSTIIFALGYLFFFKIKEAVTIERSVKTLAVISLLGAITIYGFYLYETLHG